MIPLEQAKTTSFKETLKRNSMDKNEVQKRINEEEDYIRCPKCSNSMMKFLVKNSEGVENATIARLLVITEEDVEKIYQEAILMLRSEMKDGN